MIILSILSHSHQNIQMTACRMSRGLQSQCSSLWSTTSHLRSRLTFSKNIQKTLNSCSNSSKNRSRESLAMRRGRFLQHHCGLPLYRGAQQGGLIVGAEAVRRRPHGALCEEAHHHCCMAQTSTVSRNTGTPMLQKGRTAPWPPLALLPLIRGLLPLVWDTLPALKDSVLRSSPVSFVGILGSPALPLCPQRRSHRRSWGRWRQ